MAALPTNDRLATWLRRYGPAELLSVVVTLGSSWLALSLSDSILVAAVAGTWAEFLAYYGVMTARELRARGPSSPRNALRCARDLLLEFGPAELLDSALIRPAALAAGLAAAPSPALGALAGKLVADVAFYLATIVCYELICLRRRAAGEEGAR